MNPSPVFSISPAALYIRLLIATVAAFGSTAFVTVYTRFLMHIDYHLKPAEFPGATQFVAFYGWCVAVIPAVGFLLGCLAIRRWKSGALFELAVGCQWLFACFWLACGLLVSLLPEIQMIGAVQELPSI